MSLVVLFGAQVARHLDRVVLLPIFWQALRGNAV